MSDYQERILLRCCGGRGGVMIAGMVAIVVAVMLMGVAGAALADEPAAGCAPAAAAEPMVRELLVPYADLGDILREPGAERVMMSRREFSELLAKARRLEAARPPRQVMLLSATYGATVADGRAEIVGELVVNVLDEGLHALPLEVAGVGLRRAELDGRSAAIGQADDGRLMLLVEGKGEHRLTLSMIAPLQTTAASQAMTLQLPVAPASKLQLTVAGDVELRSGAAVISRKFDEQAEHTAFELLPSRGAMNLVMTLNSRQKRTERLLVSRSVIVAEVTEAYERLHVAVSTAVLHMAVDRLRFALPDGFEVTEVAGVNMSHWAVVKDGERRVLEVTLREETTDTVLLNVLAMRMSPELSNWRLSRLEPLDVVSQVAVVGLVVEDRLKAESLQATGMASIDVGVLAQAMPASAGGMGDRHVGVRPVVAYYAAQPQFGLTGTFTRPPSRLLVTTNLLLIMEDRGLSLRGGFAVMPQEEKLFNLDVSVPAGWDVTSVTTAEGNKLAFERHERDGGMRLNIVLPSPVPAGQQQSIYFEAVNVPQGWLDEWSQPLVMSFPVCRVMGATRDVGAIAIDARDDLAATAAIAQLTPLDEAEKAAYGLSASATALAFSYDGQPYSAELTVDRKSPQLKARTISLLKLNPGALVAHYEIAWEAVRARASTLSFTLPAGTPEALSVVGCDGVQVKELTSVVRDDKRVWTVVLAEPREGGVTLLVDFVQRLESEAVAALALPLVRAAELENQTGLAAVEGSADLDVRILSPSPRRVDVGELGASRQQPGSRLLGVFSVVHPSETLRVSLERPAIYALPSAIVQRAEIVTVVSDRGVAQTAARYQMRTQAQFLEISLPAGATLWAASIDGQPLQPQRDGERLLVGLGNAPGAVAMRARRAAMVQPEPQVEQMRDLVIVYAMPVESMGLLSGLKLAAPRLVLRDDSNGRGEVPMADLLWRLYLPDGYEAVRADGLTSAEIEPRALAVAEVSRRVYWALHERSGSKSDWAANEMVCDDIEFDNSAADEGPTTGFVYRRAEGYAGDMPLPMSAPKPVEQEAPGRQQPVWAQTEIIERLPSTNNYEQAAFVTGEALRSLNIDLMPSGTAVVFRSLGADPQLDVTVAETGRLKSLALALGLAVVLVGLTLTRRRMRTKLAYVIGVALAATLLPLVTGRAELAIVFNAAFYGAILLLPWYLLAALAMWVSRLVRSRDGRGREVITATTLIAAIGVAMALAAPATASAAPPPAASADDGRGRYVIQVVEPREPVKVPADAIIVPYDPARMDVRPDELLVPMNRFRELWNLAHPDARLESAPPPAAYALAGGKYTARLGDDDTLTLDGVIEIDVFVDEYVTVLLPLEGGVLARADADGKPARVGIIAAPVAAMSALQMQQAAPQAGPAGGDASVAIYLKGKGRHRLELSVRMKLERRGGWRVASGRVPVAAATELALQVPAAATEVQLDGVKDKRLYETTAGEQVIRTALEPGGALRVQWRPKISEGQVDQGLTSQSTAVIDIQEDRVRLVWNLALQFRRSERESISFRIPAGYHVEKVEGPNVRGWQIDKESSPPRLEVSLLRTARDSESFSLLLWRPGPIGDVNGQEIEIPVIDVPEALRHTGRVTIRRSPLLDLRTVSAKGVTRTDLAGSAAASALVTGDESPLGIEPYQAYEFVTAGYDMRVAATPVESDVTAEFQTILRLAERHRELESRVLLSVRRRAVHEVKLLIPAELELQQVLAPGTFEWAVTEAAGDAERKLLTVYLGTGGSGKVAVVIQGRLSDRRLMRSVDVPRIEVVDVRQQKGQIVVQADPAFEVALAAEQQRGLEIVPKGQVYGWLTEVQRDPVRLVLRAASADYAGRLTLTKRTAVVRAMSVTNVRVTDREIQETILLDFTITNAGIRQVSFVLPASMREATIKAPLLKRTIVTPTGPEDGAPVRVVLELQDEVMQQLRVLIENDRPLSVGKGDAPIPIIETGRTVQRFVAVESAGRDEVVVERAEQLEAIGRQQREWAVVSELLQGGSTRAYLVKSSADEPRLSYATHQREEIETAGAAIELAEALLVIDAGGAFRGVQTFHVDNRTEQFLEISLPAGASLWTAHVAGKSVKPVWPAGAVPGSRNVLIPLVKMSAGDLNYTVVLKYGGSLSRLGSLREVSFPLVQSVNLSVGVSQVRLWLPEDYAWVDFGGNMRLVEEADLRQEQVSYETLQLEKLSKSILSDNVYARQRAYQNVKSLSEDNKWTTNTGFKEVEKQSKELLEADQGVQYDNRGRFNSAFELQYNERSGQIQNIDGNWRRADVSRPGSDESNAKLRGEWLEQSGLDKGDKAGGKRVGMLKPGEAKDEPANQPQGPEVFKRELQDFGKGVPKFNLSGSVEGRASGTGGGSFYGVGSGGRVARDDESVVVPGDGVESEWTYMTRFRGGYDQNSMGETELVAAGGLASLDVEIPVRGTEYRFTTPRGEVAVTARPVSRTMMDSLKQIGLVVLFIVAAVVVVRVVRRLRRRVSPVVIAAGLLILLGLIGMIVLPMAGAALVIVGLAMLAVYGYRSGQRRQSSC